MIADDGGRLLDERFLATLMLPAEKNSKPLPTFFVFWAGYHVKKLMFAIAVRPTPVVIFEIRLPKAQSGFRG